MRFAAICTITRLLPIRTNQHSKQAQTSTLLAAGAAIVGLLSAQHHEQDTTSCNTPPFVGEVFAKDYQEKQDEKWKHVYEKACGLELRTWHMCITDGLRKSRGSLNSEKIQQDCHHDSSLLKACIDGNYDTKDFLEMVLSTGSNTSKETIRRRLNEVHERRKS